MDALAITNFDGVRLSITPEALLQRDNALVTSRRIATVTDPATQQNAVDALRTLKAFLTALEKSREAVKRPVLDLSREIDAIAKKTAADVAVEVSRVNGLVVAYQRAEAEKAARAQKMRDDMARRKREREQEEADRLAAEQRRLEAEAQSAETEEARKLAEAKAETARQLAEETAAKAEAIVAAPVAAPAKAAGMVVAKTWKYRVTDLPALYAARPDLCVLEPSPSRINAELRGGLRECAGLEIFEELNTTVRSA